jgi:hypothetical protein
MNKLIPLVLIAALSVLSRFACALSLLFRYRGHLKQVICCLALGLFVSGGAARATLITINDPTFGPNSLILDTSTGLEWLNAKFSVGLDPTQVTADFQSGARFAGFRYASQDEYIALTTNFFGFDPIGHMDLDLTKTESFADLFGPTFFLFGLPAIEGYYGVERFPVNLQGCIGIFEPDNSNLSYFGDRQCFFGFANGDLGSFLVRTSEPASLSLFSAGLIAIAVVMQRRKQKAGSRSCKSST